MCKRIFIRKLTVNITLTNEKLEVCLPRLTRVCTATAITTKQKEKRTGKCCVSRWKHLPPSAERTHEMGPMPSHYDAFAFLLRNVIPKPAVSDLQDSRHPKFSSSYYCPSRRAQLQPFCQGLSLIHRHRHKAFFHRNFPVAPLPKTALGFCLALSDWFYLRIQELGRVSISTCIHFGFQLSQEAGKGGSAGNIRSRKHDFRTVQSGESNGNQNNAHTRLQKMRMSSHKSTRRRKQSDSVT